MVSVAREMHALDLMSYYHDNEIACVNVSQSIHCMPMVATHEEYLPCLTCETKYESSVGIGMCVFFENPCWHVSL